MARRPDVFRRTQDGGITIRVWRGQFYQRSKRLPLISDAEAADIMRQIGAALRRPARKDEPESPNRLRDPLRTG